MYMKTTLLFIALILTGSASFACCTPPQQVQVDGTSDSLSTTGSEVLSMTLVNFAGTLTDQQGVDLSWGTMMELNVDHFEIQRSGDGISFQDISRVASQMEISTNAYELYYHAADANPLPGISYYRLKVVGKNGSTSQSPVIQINNLNALSGAKIYPTLIENNMVFVESDKNLSSVRMEFFDLSGKKISETDMQTLNGRQSVQVSKSGRLPTGTYLARLTAGGQNVKNQLVIVECH
jgi:trimeric autotransporter adhesin